MGIEEDNWPAVLGIVSGVLAKEVIVGTLDAVYGKLAADAEPTQDEAEFQLGAALAEAAATVPANLAGVVSGLTDPLGLGVGDLSDSARVAAEQEVQTGTFGAMSERFDGRAGAFAYLLFVLLYFPCVATIAAIVRETGAVWATFVAAWTTGIAYIVATFFYQAATFERDPVSASIWIGGLLVVLLGVFAAMRLWAKRGAEAALSTHAAAAARIG
jgi:ferrous iron transport protein B